MKKTTITIILFFLLTIFLSASEPLSDSEIQAEMQKAITEIQNKRYRNAVQLLNSLISKAPNFDKAKYLLGKCYALLNEYENASRIFGIILSQNPNDPYALMEAGSTSLYMYQFQRALYYYTQLEKIAQNSPYPVFGLIQISMIQGKYVKAKEYIDKLTEMQNSFANADLIISMYRARLLMHQHLVIEAYDLLDRMDGNNAAILLEKSSILMDMSNIKMAEETTLKAYNIGMRNEEVYANLINVYIKLKKFAEAARYINEYKEKLGEDFKYYFFLGMLYQHENKMDKAIESYLRSVGRNRYFINGYMSLIESYSRIGKHDLSLQWAEQAAELFSEVKGIELVRAKALFKTGKKQEALNLVNKIVSAHGDNLTLLINVSYFLWTEIKEYAFALKLMLKASELYPDNDRVLNNLAYFYATIENTQMRNPALALKYSEIAVKKTRRMNAAYLDTLAAAYFANGQTALALKTQREALEMNPADETFIANLKKYTQSEGSPR